MVDVLRSVSDTVQAGLIAHMKDAGSSNTVLLVLARLQSVDAFKVLVNLLRDDDGQPSADNGVRNMTTPRTSEGERTPLLAETVFNSLAMVATDKAEYYLRDLSDDATLAYEVRKAVAKAANVAYRRRVPLHIRRAERS